MDAIEVGGLVVHTGTVSHPLLGRAHVIEDTGGRPITAMSEIDWNRPMQIPTVAEPRRLPPGTGSALLNEIAQRAQRAGVQTMRYAGPYPTHALFKSLLRSFRADEGAETTFTANVLDRAMRLARDEVPVDFVPAPFSRRPTAHGFADTRDGEVDRVSINGVLYDEDGTIGSLARLVYRTALLGFNEPYRYAEIAELDDRGELRLGPRSIPQLESEAIGKSFPPELREQLAETVTEFVAPPLAADVSRVVREREVSWEDLGWRSATKTDDGFALHAVIFHLLAANMGQFAMTVSYHLAMIAQATVLDELTESLR